MKRKSKTCRNCNQQFLPLFSTAQAVCSTKCAIEYSSAKSEQKIKKAWGVKKTAMKDELKTVSELLKIAQAQFNTFIRLRDNNKPCISCGQISANSGWDAGHYLPVGRYSSLRFDENNVHKQCKRPCNLDLHGNIVEYRIGLIKRIGIHKVEELESKRNDLKKWTQHEVEDLIQLYKMKIREAKKNI